MGGDRRAHALASRALARLWQRRLTLLWCGYLWRPVVGAPNVTAEGTPNVTLFKRTHASCAAGRDGDFVADRLGMTVTSNVSYACADYECGHRVVASTLASFEMHYFASDITPQKDVTACDFARDFKAANDFASSDWVWSEWISQSATFYAPNLRLHLRNWDKAGVPFLGRYRADRHTETKLYSARVVVPHSGNVVEIVSGDVGEFAANFSAYEAGECGASAQIAASLESMESTWVSLDGRASNAAGVPDLLIVQLGMPAAEISALPAFLTAYSEASLNTTVASSAGGLLEDCEWSSTALQLSATDVDWAVTLRLTYNALASADSNYSASFHAAYVADAMDATMGCDAGYSRYVDSHIGVTLEGTSLDANAKALCDAGVGIHTGDAGQGSGSNWARGTSGLGVEFQGEYDYTFFPAWDIYVLDYCSADGFGTAADACVVTHTSHHRSNPWSEPFTAAASLLGSRWFWLGLVLFGGLGGSCYLAAHGADAALDEGAARRARYGGGSTFRSRVRGALARATARMPDEAAYVVVKDEDAPMATAVPYAYQAGAYST